MFSHTQSQVCRLGDYKASQADHEHHMLTLLLQIQEVLCRGNSILNTSFIFYCLLQTLGEFLQYNGHHVFHGNSLTYTAPLFLSVNSTFCMSSSSSCHASASIGFPGVFRRKEQFLHCPPITSHISQMNICFLARFRLAQKEGTNRF